MHSEGSVVSLTAPDAVVSLTPKYQNNPDSKVHGANMGPIWGRQDPGGTHVGPMKFVIWETTLGVWL